MISANPNKLRTMGKLMEIVHMSLLVKIQLGDIWKIHENLLRSDGIQASLSDPRQLAEDSHMPTLWTNDQGDPSSKKEPC